MEYPISKFLVLNRRLPKPYHEISKLQPHYHSKYSPPTTASTILVPLLKAALAYRDIDSGGAVGWDKNKLCISEYPSSKPGITHLVAYRPTDGDISAALYNSNDNTYSAYSYDDGRDSTAIILAMIPFLVQNSEFGSHWKELLRLDIDPKDTKVVECLAVLSDNIYRRMADKDCEDYIRMNIDSTGQLPLINQLQIDSMKFAAYKLEAGNFKVFKPHNGRFIRPQKNISHADFVGQYTNPDHALESDEQAMVPQLASEYVIPEEIELACRHAAFKGKMLMRNFLLRGPAGTGKSAGAKAMAAGLGLPYVYMTCSVNTEVFDFIGQYVPNEDDGAYTGDIQQDILYDPESAYLKITGNGKEGATAEDCYSALFENSDGKSKSAYRYMETDFIKAIKHGYLCEIQEPSCIMQPGVLVGLNALLERDGMITLPNGEQIKRHPDTVIVLTTNTDYEGCKPLNQSVIDRMNMVIDMDMPDEQTMKERAAKLTGFDDEKNLELMVKTIIDISEHCRKTGIVDGSCGMRSLIDWISSTMVTGMPYESALNTVISKATDNPDDRNDIIDTYLSQHFYEGQKIA